MTALIGRPAPAAAVAAPPCRHCGLPAPEGQAFCCHGCAAAFETIQQMGLGQYYTARELDPGQRAPRPEGERRDDLSAFVHTRADGSNDLELTIDGVQCGGSRMAGRVRLATMEGIASLYLASRFARLRQQQELEGRRR